MLGWRTFGIALALNFLWEMAQMFAYTDVKPFSIQSFLICFGAAVADALYVMCVYSIGRTIRRTPCWIFKLGIASVLIIALSGFFTAFGFERIAVAEDFWRYGKAMPKLLFGVGLWPILQLMILPLLTFWLVSHWPLRSGDPGAQDEGRL